MQFSLVCRKVTARIEAARAKLTIVNWYSCMRCNVLIQFLFLRKALGAESAPEFEGSFSVFLPHMPLQILLSHKFLAANLARQFYPFNLVVFDVRR